MTILLEIGAILLSLAGILVLCWWDAQEPEDLGRLSEGWRRRNL